MESLKTKEIRQPVVEHLLREGIAIDERHDLRSVLDNPYAIISGGVLVPTSSREEFRMHPAKEVNEGQLLKFKRNSKPESREEQIAKRLVKYLNSNKAKGLNGYEVIFDYQKHAGGLLCKFEVLPISPNACGSISPITMKKIIEWFEDNYIHQHYSFSYTDYNNKKERYGTYRPCIMI